MEESLKDKEGTIETLERQLVQAGIKDKISKAEVQIAKKVGDIENSATKDSLETEAKHKFAQKVIMDSAAQQKQRIKMEADNIIKNLQTKTKSE